MRPHQKLEAWSKAIDLVTDVYKSTERFNYGTSTTKKDTRIGRLHRSR